MVLSSPWLTATCCLNCTSLRFIQPHTVGESLVNKLVLNSRENQHLFLRTFGLLEDPQPILYVLSSHSSSYYLCTVYIYNMIFLFAGCSQEVSWLRDSSGDDRGEEIFKLRLSEGGVHQHLPCWEGDPVCLFGCCKTNQIRRLGNEGKKGVKEMR